MTGRRRTIRTIAMWVSAAVIGGLITLVIMAMPRGPFRYYMADPANREERKALLGKLDADHAHFVEVSKTASASGANDPDNLWPMDRTRIVAEIERFRLSHGRLPNSMEELGRLEDLALAGGWSLQTNGGQWTLSRPDFKAARGN